MRPSHYSTAADLATLTEQALQQPFFSMMVRTLVRDISTVDGTRKLSLHSTNELLVDPDVNGVKTGYTSKAGRCLIASMFKDGHRLLLVGLNLMDQWEQATKLLRYGQAVVQGIQQSERRRPYADRLLPSDVVKISIAEVLLGEDDNPDRAWPLCEILRWPDPSRLEARRHSPVIVRSRFIGGFADGVGPEQSRSW